MSDTFDIPDSVRNIKSYCHLHKPLPAIMKKLTLGFTFLILISSCNQKQPELESLWKQTSPNGKVVIYKYNYQSMMAFGSGKYGNKLANKNLPAVLVYFSILFDPSSLTVLNVEIIFECKLTDLLSKACSISSTP